MLPNVAKPSPTLFPLLLLAFEPQVERWRPSGKLGRFDLSLELVRAAPPAYFFYWGLWHVWIQ